MSAPGYALHQEKEKLYVELKHILARQPGPEAAQSKWQALLLVGERRPHWGPSMEKSMPPHGEPVS
jgi:hypothetical protein